MSHKKIQPVKILILFYCISLVSLALRDFHFTLVYNQPAFFLIFLTPIIIAALTITAYILKRRRILFYATRTAKPFSVSELIIVILLEAAFIFGLIVAWHNVLILTNAAVTIFIVITCISNALFVIYIIFWLTNRKKKQRQVTERFQERVDSIMKEKTKQLDFASMTQLLGFNSNIEHSAVENGYVFSIPEEHIYADFFERIKVTYDEVFKGISIVLKLKSDSLLSLDIRKRDSTFSNQRNEFSISPLSNVYTLNSQTPEIWENFLSDPIFQQNLLLLRPYFEHFSLKGEYVEALVYSDTAIVKLIDWVMEMNPSMELMTKSIDASDADTLLCYNCQDPFDPLEEKCNKCGAQRPRCIICFQDLKPEEEDDVVMLPCCEIYAHKDHIMTWLEKKSICPNCHKSLSRWMNQKRISRGF